MTETRHSYVQWAYDPDVRCGSPDFGRSFVVFRRTIIDERLAGPFRSVRAAKKWIEEHDDQQGTLL